MSRGRCGILALLVSLAAALAGAAEPSPAVTREIRAGNLAEAGQWLLPSIRRWVERGDFVLRVGELRYAPRWDEEFLKASTANQGRYAIDAELNVVDARSGARPDFVFGLPFPAIDPSDPDAGVKVMWNRWYTVYKRTQVRVPSHIHVLGREGLVRDVEALTTTVAYSGREGEPLANPEQTEYREIVLQTSPSYVEGVATLTWRFRDERWDSLWVYVPLARRVRQATSANRSDALAGTDVTLDDALVWAGKNQSFTWKLVGSQDVLVPTMSLDPQPLHAGRRWQNGTEWMTGADYQGVLWGYQVPGWTGAPWAPTNAYWVKRPVWVVEGRPRDRYYSYGRQLFYVDRDTFQAYAKVIDTPAGEYWKTVLVDLGMSCAPDNQRCYPVVAMSLFVDDKNDRATATSVAGPGSVVYVNTPRVRAEQFTLQGLLKQGK
ncbi:MAG: DUF1329 domain-containing protein [Deltaproteobacteria bacterium]|nr:DUF1329 domain-containing protein [Deltaproteobacteria bacterium]